MKNIILCFLLFIGLSFQSFCQKNTFNAQKKSYDRKSDTYLLIGDVQTTIENFLFSNDCTLINELEGIYTFYGSKDKPIIITDLSDSLEEYLVDSTYVLHLFENEGIIPYQLQAKPCGDSFGFGPDYHSDSSTFNMRTQILKLYKNAFIKFDNISFKGDDIEINFETKILILKGSDTLPIKCSILLNDSIPYSSNPKIQNLLNHKNEFYIKNNCLFKIRENNLEYLTN